MESGENKKVYVADLAEKEAVKKVEMIRDFDPVNTKTTVFELMSTIYNFMSECYTHSELLEKTRAVKVLADSISKELLEELEGLEP